jgi:3-hydroxyisobutyrate dehydrogenase
VTRLRVAALGHGAMGAAMVRRLLSFYDVTAFDPSSQALQAAISAGAQVAGTPAEAATGCSLVLISVRDREQLDVALFGPAGASEGLEENAVVLLTSTVGPTEVRSLDRRLAARGVELVDAPVSGGPRRAATGELLAMVGARPEAFERARPVLDRLATRVEHVGSHPGDGQALKVVNQLLCGVHIAAAAEALALAERLGLDAERALDALQQGAAASFMLGDRGPRMLLDGSSSVQSRLDIFVKDMAIVLENAREVRVPVPVAAASEQLYMMASCAGLAADDDSRVIDLLRETSHTRERQPPPEVD